MVQEGWVLEVNLEKRLKLGRRGLGNQGLAPPDTGLKVGVVRDKLEERLTPWRINVSEEGSPRQPLVQGPER